MQLDFWKTLLQPKAAAECIPSFSPPLRPIQTGSSRQTEATFAEEALMDQARSLLLGLGATRLAERLRIEWNSRMRSTAGMAYPRECRIILNPRLIHFGFEEVDRTLRHELAHLLAHDRAGRRRIAPHGPEWVQACKDLGLDSENRCHNLPLPRRELTRRYRYRCPHCAVEIARVRPIRRKSACFACCRAFNHGQYDDRFRLSKVV